jgi:type I restriction enzyme S subunit
MTLAVATTRGLRIKTLYRVIDERAGIHQPPLLSVSIHRGVIRRDSVTDDLPRAEDLSNYKLCNEGDIVLNRMRAFQGAIGISRERGLVSPDYLVLRPSPCVEGRFLHHLFRSAWFVGEMVARLRGIGSIGQGNVRTPRINAEDLGDIRVDLPSLDQQRRIADFLDAETGRIDTLISKRELQRRLLDEKVLAAAYSAVVGLGESTERRDSRIKWLGSVPDSWPVMPVGYQFEVLLGKMLNQERVRGNHLRPYLRNTNVQWDRIHVDDLLEMDFLPEERVRYRVLPGDLLICEGGEPGRAAIWDGLVGEIYYQKALHRVRPRGYSSSRWLYYCMRAATAQNVFAIEGNTTTIAHLTGEQLRAYGFPFPPRSTQDRIVAELDEFNTQQNRLATLLARQQSLLLERREALITATVTGQIDVSAASGRGIED